MTKFLFSMLAVFAVSAPLTGVCYKCEVIREENKKLPPPKHEYYEDYLEEQKAEGKTTSGAVEFIEESPAKDVSLNKEDNE
ncbi:hypothetical protein [Estrella lausannensis]|nr:hypothetical protein [Estrella lausannensis]